MRIHIRRTGLRDNWRDFYFSFVRHICLIFILAALLIDDCSLSFETLHFSHVVFFLKLLLVVCGVWFINMCVYLTTFVSLSNGMHHSWFEFLNSLARQTNLPDEQFRAKNVFFVSCCCCCGCCCCFRLFILHMR